MTKWALGAEIKASRNDKFSILHGPQISSGQAHPLRAISSPFLPFPPCSQTHIVLNPSQICTQEIKLGYSQCNQDPSNSYLRPSLWFPSQFFLCIAATDLPEMEISSCHTPQRGLPESPMYIHTVPSFTCLEGLYLHPAWWTTAVFQSGARKVLPLCNSLPQLSPGIMSRPCKCSPIVLNIHLL